MSDVPVDVPPVDPVVPATDTQVAAPDVPADVQPIVEPPAPDITEPPLVMPDAGSEPVPPVLYLDDVEVRPKGGRINNSKRQIKLRTVPNKLIKRIADGT